MKIRKLEFKMEKLLQPSPSNIPGVGSHYDFISRLWLENPEIEQKRQDELHPFRSKPRKKFGKNKKTTTTPSWNY